MKNLLLIATAFFFITLTVNADPIKRAQKKMRVSDYSAAEKILRNAIISNEYHATAIPMLAECYRLENDMVNAGKYYRLALDLPGALPEWYYYEAQALRSTGNYLKAKEMFLIYADLRPDDPRGKKYASYCDSVLGPWKSNFPEYDVKTVENINSPESDFGPSFYAGQLIFASERNLNMDPSKYGWRGKGYIELVNTSPNKADEFWGGMEPAKLFNSKFNKSYHDGPAVFVGENLVYFTRTFTDSKKKPGNALPNHLAIYSAVRSDGKWGPLQPFFLNSNRYSVGYPALSADGNTLVFVSDMPNGMGGTDIWVCRKECGKWGQPENPGPEFNTAGNEIFPGILPDGSLLFSSDGLPGYGGQDIFSSKMVHGDWSTPVNAGAPLNSSYDDFGISYAPALTGGFFSSNRPGGEGSYDIYAFRELKSNEAEITKLDLSKKR